MRRKIVATLARTAVAVSLGLIVVLGARLSAGAEAPEQVWLISTREAPTCQADNAAADSLDCRRLGPAGQWIPADFQAFLATDDPAVPTGIFIHGNRMDRHSAVQTGMEMHQVLKRVSKGRPLRFVIWSWPTDRIRGRNRQDVRVKASRSDVDAFYLAQCLDRVDPAVPVSMIGYSFGARIITGAMHILDGGRVAGRGLPERSSQGCSATRTMRAVLIAGALDADWLLPGRRNGQALDQLDRVLITVNCCDPVMKWYPLMYYRGGPQALGYAGPACEEQLGRNRRKIELTRVSHQVGKTHDWDRYSTAPNLLRRLARFTFFASP